MFRTELTKARAGLGRGQNKNKRRRGQESEEARTEIRKGQDSA